MEILPSVDVVEIVVVEVVVVVVLVVVEAVDGGGSVDSIGSNILKKIKIYLVWSLISFAQ